MIAGMRLGICTAPLLLASYAAFSSASVLAQVDEIPQVAPHGPVLVAFDGIEQLAQEASRQRMLSQKLDFTLTIDPQGMPVECELSRKFRRKATEIALCRPLLKHMRFELALDDKGSAVSGRYSSTINFDMWMTQRGYLEAEDR